MNTSTAPNLENRLRRIAAGSYPDEAAVELLIRNRWTRRASFVTTAPTPSRVATGPGSTGGPSPRSSSGNVRAPSWPPPAVNCASCASLTLWPTARSPTRSPDLTANTWTTSSPPSPTPEAPTSTKDLRLRIRTVVGQTPRPASACPSPRSGPSTHGRPPRPARADHTAPPPGPGPEGSTYANGRATTPVDRWASVPRAGAGAASPRRDGPLPLRVNTIAINGTQQTLAPAIPDDREAIIDAIQGNDVTH